MWTRKGRTVHATLAPTHDPLHPSQPVLESLLPLRHLYEPLVRLAHARERVDECVGERVDEGGVRVGRRVGYVVVFCHALLR